MQKVLVRNVTLGCALIFAATVATAAPDSYSGSNEYQWLDAHGVPLPYENDSELLEFLTTASVVSEKDIGVGINSSKKLLIDKDGVQAHAIFREADMRKDTARVDGDIYRFFVDSYLFEPAAYHLAKMLDLHNIPPAAVRFVGRRKGSIQIWIEEVVDEEGADFRPPSAMAWVQQTWDRFFFDNLVYNIDRNPGNILVTKDYRQWMIDHTRAFQYKNELKNDKLVKIRRSSWERLLALSEEEIRNALRDYLTIREMNSLLRRRKLIIEHINELLNERGEEAVFYPLN